jgi:hypothetical protein
MNRFFVRISFYQVIILSLIWMPFCVSFRPCAHPTGTGSLTKQHSLPFIRLTTTGRFPSSSSLAMKNFETQPPEEERTIYQLLCTPRDRNRKPGGSNIFFYNDEVASHLHGYMFLVGGLLALDEVREYSTSELGMYIADIPFKFSPFLSNSNRLLFLSFVHLHRLQREQHWQELYPPTLEYQQSLQC